LFWILDFGFGNHMLVPPAIRQDTGFKSGI
jgi:hypothetical protein